MDIFLFFTLGLAVGLTTTHLCVKLFPYIGLLDFPERYGLLRNKIPYPGGVAFALCAAFALWLHPAFHLLSYPVAALAIISLTDDRKPLPALLRLSAQVLLAVWVWQLGGQITFLGNPISDTNIAITSAPVSLVLTVVWVLLIQNAMNFLDGLKGLSIGVSGIGFLTLGLLGLFRPELFFDPTHTPITHINLLLAGLCLGGFWFFYKGKIILGDTGSQTMGFLLGVMSIWSGAKIATTLLVLGLPIIDALLTIIRRIFIDKKAPWVGDQQHLHHLLLRHLSEQKTVLLFILLSVGFGISAVLPSRLGKLISLVLMLLLVLSLWWWAYVGHPPVASGSALGAAARRIHPTTKSESGTES